MSLVHRATRQTSDPVRQGAVLAAALAQAAVPLVLRRVDPRTLGRPSADVAPAPATFAVWAPIMALGVAHGVAQARPGAAADPVLRRVGWPTAAAFASTGAWAPLVVRARWWPAQGAIAGIAASAGLATVRLGRAEREGELGGRQRALTVAPVAMLAGWGTAACGVNLASMLVGTGVVGRGAAERRLALATIAGLGAAGATGVRAAGPRTATARVFGATVLWALGGVAVAQRGRFRAGAAGALAAVALVAGALATT
jgi:hypothetical protein